MSEQYTKLVQKAYFRCGIAIPLLVGSTLAGSVLVYEQLNGVEIYLGVLINLFLLVGVFIGVWAAGEEEASPADWILTAVSASVVSAFVVLLALVFGGATDHTRNVAWTIWAASVAWMIVSAVVVEMIMARTLRRE